MKNSLEDLLEGIKIIRNATQISEGFLISHHNFEQFVECIDKFKKDIRKTYPYFCKQLNDIQKNFGKRYYYNNQYSGKVVITFFLLEL